MNWPLRRVSVSVTCEFCGKEFQTQQRVKRYCNDDCRNIHYKVKKETEKESLRRSQRSNLK